MRHCKTLTVIAVVAAGSGGCVMDTEREAARGSAYAVAEQMLAAGIDPGPVVEGDQADGCVCGTGISSLCDYVYYPAAEVCFPTSESQTGEYYEAGEVWNIEPDDHLSLWCSFGTIYYYAEGYDPSDLYDVSVWSVKPTSGMDNISIGMYAWSMTEGTPDFQDWCDLTTSSSSPQQTRCYTEPLDPGQVLVSMPVTLPDMTASYEYYRVRGFRLCYDPD